MDEQSLTAEATPNEELGIRNEELGISQPPDGGNEELAPEAQPEISLGEDGEVSFADGFFGDADSPLPSPGPLSPPQGGKEGEEPPGTGKAVAPAGYTDDELRDTPWEQWDADRITGDVKRYIPILQEQMRRREAVIAQMAAAQGRMAAQPGGTMNAGYAATAPQLPGVGPMAQPPMPQPAPMTPKEIAAAAGKLAKQRLGLGEEDELDFYEPEHVAAMSIAAQEVKAQEQAQIARTQQIARERREFGAFAADLAARNDFAKFDQWVTQKLAAAGMHPAQLEEYAARTGDVAGVQRTIQGWWNAWKQQTQPQPARAKVPAVETAGGAVGVKKAINLQDFGELDEDGQARALMEAGLV